MNRIKIFEDLMGEYIPDNVLEQLKANGFFTAPASVHHHSNYSGGLFDHSYEVTRALLFLTEKLGLHWENPRSPYIVGMFHDLCKLDNYKKTGYEAWEYNNATVLPGHGEKSVILVQRLFGDLTDEEILCIRWHMGAFDSKENWNSYGRSVTMYPNVLYTHTADMIAARIIGV